MALNTVFKYPINIPIKSQRLAVEIVASVVFAILFFWLWPTDLILDDGGIVLRYMDNFSKGYFYSYNPSDGPIFGISGFLHGVLSGILAYLHILSPLKSLFASNFIGLFLTSIFMFRLISYYTQDYKIILPCWILVMTSSPYFIISIKQGLETPLHLSIVLMCFLALLSNKHKLMWLSFVLAIISKLDAVPIILILSFIFLLRNYKIFKLLSARINLINDFVLYALFPGILWIAFCVMVFGSPLPQSAYAKLYYHVRTSSHWFPFIEPMLGDITSRSLIICMSLLSLVYLVYCLITKTYERIVDVLFIDLTLLAQITLYYFYNPPERYPWYYAIPEFLIRLQIIAVICTFFEMWTYKGKFVKVIVVYVSLLLIGIASLPQSLLMMESMNYSLRVTESERIAIGRWINDNSKMDDRLLAAHGHIAREAGLYTIDYSGINSKIAIEYQLNYKNMVKDLNPEWIVQHGLLDRNLQLTGGYVLRKSYYNIAMFGFPAWRVYERAGKKSSSIAFALKQAMIKTSGQIIDWNGAVSVNGADITFSGFQETTPRTYFVVGVTKSSQNCSLEASIYGEGGILLKKATLMLDKRDSTRPVEGFTEEWTIDLDPNWQITSMVIKARDDQRQKREVKLMDPIFLEEAKPPV